MVEKLFSEARKAKEAYDRKWSDQWKFFRGKQWPERRPSYRHSEVLNFIFSEVYNVLALLTDTRPNIEVLPEDPTDLEFSEILSQVLKSKWHASNWAATLAEAILDASIFGTSIGYVSWKPELMNGLGDFGFETEDVFYFFPDPMSRTRINDEYCDYVICAKPQSIKKLKARYPDKADFLATDIGPMLAQAPEIDLFEEIRYKSPTDNRVLFDGGKLRYPEGRNQTLEITCYLKSDEMVEEETGEETDPDTGLIKKLYQARKKYPNGRKVVIANGVLLEDGENPYLDGKFPYARLVDHELSRTFWGVGEVEQLRSPQVIVNKLISYVLDVLTITGNPIWKVTSNAAVDTDRLTNQPGLVVEYSPDGRVERESGVQLQPFILDTLQFMSERIMAKLGSTADVSKGVAPTDNSSGYAIAQLQEAAQTKIRGKARNVEYFLKDIGDLMVDRILQFYTIPRVIRLTSNQEAAKYFKFAISEREDESGEIVKVAEVVEYEQDPRSGQYIQGPTRQVPLKSKLDVRIGISSALPFAKIEAKALSEKLFDKGIIDAEEYLKQIEYPNREQIVARLKERMASMPPAPPGGSNANAGAPA